MPPSLKNSRNSSRIKYTFTNLSTNKLKIDYIADSHNYTNASNLVLKNCRSASVKPRNETIRKTLFLIFLNFIFT